MSKTTVSKTLDNPLIYSSSPINKGSGYNTSATAGAAQIANKILFNPVKPNKEKVKVSDAPKNMMYNQDPELCSFNLPPHIWSLPVGVNSVIEGTKTNSSEQPTVVPSKNTTFFQGKGRVYE